MPTPYTTKEGLVKLRVDAANGLWIAVEKEFFNDAISWFVNHRGLKGDHSFHAEFNFAEGVMEIRREMEVKS